MGDGLCVRGRGGRDDQWKWLVGACEINGQGGVIDDN